MFAVGMMGDRRQSKAEFARACRLMPGGVNSPARAFGAVGGSPIFVHKAEGPYLFDIDGNRYVDYVGSWGVTILGHAHPSVVAAIREAAARGTSFGAPTRAETELAELIVRAVPSIEKVRFVNSGTEATMSAIRLARGFTGREKIIKFAGNYHGHVDSLLVAAGSSGATLSVPDSLGVTAGTATDTIVLPYNDVDALAQTFERCGHEIAGVIIEPVVGNMGCVPPRPGFLERVRDVTARNGTLLIFDEVITGFRVSYGGAQQLYKVAPDLTTLGKIVGGGLPFGAYGGRAEIMDYVLPVGRVFQAGTLSGNPLATAAGIVTLKLLRDDPPYERLERLGARLEAGFASAAAAANVPHCVQRVGSMMTLFFHKGPVDDWAAASHCDRGQFTKFFWEMIGQGIYLPCSQFEAMFISGSHTEEDIDATVAACRHSLARVV